MRKHSVLTLRIGQTIELIPGVFVCVVGLANDRDKVKIGIDAPIEIVVDRAEVHQRKLQGIPPAKGVRGSANVSRKRVLAEDHGSAIDRDNG